MEETINRIQNETLLPKLRTFKLFKEEYKLENYLTVIKDKRYQTALIRFRISSHNLRIETGRYDKPKTPAQNRKCIYCTLNLVEDEQHLLITCPLYQTHRDSLFEKSTECIPDFNTLTDREKFIQIMSSKDTDLLNSLAEYIFLSFKLRNDQA